MVNPATGEPAAQAVHGIDDLYQAMPGPDARRRHQLNDNARITTELATPRYGTFATPTATRWRPSIPATTDRTPSVWRSLIAGGATLGARTSDPPRPSWTISASVPPYMTGRVLRAAAADRGRRRLMASIARGRRAAHGTIALVLSGAANVVGYLVVVVLARSWPGGHGTYGVIMAVLVWLSSRRGWRCLRRPLLLAESGGHGEPVERSAPPSI
jgi:hypothetical protein